MKRLICGVLCILMLATMLTSCGCQRQEPIIEAPATETPTEAPTEDAATVPEEPVAVIETDDTMIIAEGSILFGVDISGMTAEEAYTAVSEALSLYTLQVTVNGRSLTLKAEDMSLGCTEEEVAAYLEELESGATPTKIPTITYNASLLRSAIASRVNVGATNASVVYRSSVKEFRVASESAGYTVDMGPIMELVKPAVESLASAVKVTAAKQAVLPTVTADDPALQAAADAANTYLQVSLSYTYAPKDEIVGTETLSKDTIGSFISFDSSHNPYLNTTKINNYASRMASRYDQDGKKDKFKTTNGSYISIMVPYSGASVDTDALAEDIRSCLQNKTSGTRAAPYIDLDVLENMPYGGTYIEINLSSQHIWMYKNGTCVASGPLVSGCVYDGNRTPTGVYSIRSKSRNTYLVGPTWRDFVYYWMPFVGAVGLHDATWRSSFGGDIYLYEGSHGCVNLPTNVAADIYNNCKVGTKVIVYGGASKASPVTQTINGTTSYALTVDSPSFLLDAAPAYGSYALTYTSSNTAVVEVSSDGTVTVKGPGSATITASLPAQAFYTAAELQISITVSDPCNGGHTYGEWSVTKEATCAAGTEARVCSVCGKQETRSIDPVLDHTYGEWTVTKESTCAAGEQTHTCSLCGKTETQAVDPVQEHSYGEWTVTKEASCAASGEKSCTCSACGHTKTESISKADHDFSSGGQYCGNGCGTENPSYTSPSEEETTSEE